MTLPEVLKLSETFGTGLEKNDSISETFRNKIHGVRCTSNSSGLILSRLERTPTARMVPWLANRILKRRQAMFVAFIVEMTALPPGVQSYTTATVYVASSSTTAVISTPGSSSIVLGGPSGASDWIRGISIMSFSFLFAVINALVPIIIFRLSHFRCLLHLPFFFSNCSVRYAFLQLLSPVCFPFLISYFVYTFKLGS